MSDGILSTYDEFTSITDIRHTSSNKQSLEHSYQSLKGVMA